MSEIRPADFGAGNELVVIAVRKAAEQIIAEEFRRARTAELSLTDGLDDVGTASGNCVRGLDS